MMANKVKTKKGAKKRFNLTATGKVMRRHGYSSHLKDSKNSARLRRQGEPAEVTGKDKISITRLLGK
ncbi:MAG: 50S ribosomal protein L35 [bacterium]|nr:50S ribosomal protein L35 [bacterium]